MNETASHIIKEIFDVNNAAWEETALKIFAFQYRHNSIYRRFCDALRVKPDDVKSIGQVPFLPIQFFKTHHVSTMEMPASVVFESSGTTGSVNSRHHVQEPAIYEESFLKGFEKFYGSPAGYCIIGLLPSYLERGSSSLVYMVNDLIKRSAHPGSGFYLDDYKKLKETLLRNESAGQKTLLIGVTYALLDFAENYPLPLQHTIVMETGGMKGRRRELTREEVHSILQHKLQISTVHSEYGMTELLSQAYSAGKGIFYPSDTLRVLLRAEDDPFDVNSEVPPGKNFISGAVNIVDLANIYSCSFIATDDMGKLFPGGSFEVLGRLDNSDIRGCGLMIL